MDITISWLGRLKRGNVPTETITKTLEQLSFDDRSILDRMILRILNECPGLDIMPAKGYKPFGLHVQVPNSPPPFVYVAIVPRLKAGLLVLTRRGLLGFEKSSDSQLRWQKTVSCDEDIDSILRYCKGLQ